MDTQEWMGRSNMNQISASFGTLCFEALLQDEPLA